MSNPEEAIPPPPQPSINTGSGTYIERDVNNSGGINILGGNNNVYVSPYKPGEPVFMLPQRPPDNFVGRADLMATLKEQLFAGGPVAVAALNGKAGVGKTSLALAIGWDDEVRSHFEGGILWAALGPNPNLDYELRRWVEVLGGDPQGAATPEALVDKVQAALGDRRYLMIIDDVWEADHARLFGRIVRPGCAQLLTSRQEGLANDFAPRHFNRLEELDEARSVELLATLCPKAAQTDQAALHRIARAVGGLPLALTLVGGYLRSQSRLQAQTVKAFKILEQAESWLGLQDPTRKLTLDQIVKLSVDALPSDAHRTLFYRLAPFTPKPASFSVEAALALGQTDDLDLVTTLLDFSLLEKLEGLEDERLALHQVIAEIALRQARTQGQLDDLRHYHAQYYLDLVNEDPKNWQKIEPEWPQIQHAWEECVSDPQRQDDRVLPYIWALREFQRLRGLGPEGIVWIERGLIVVRAVGDQQIEGTLLNNLAAYHSNLGEQAKALEYYDQALRLDRTLGNRGGEAVTLNNIGGSTPI